MRRVLECLDNAFGESKSSLYVHMFADSLVIAEKEKKIIETSTDKFLKLMLDIQYGILIDSETLAHRVEVDNPTIEPPFMPVLSRALIKRGEYYGIITSEFQNDIDNLFSNFSLVGGDSIVDMDRDLQGLPMGTYINNSIISELHIEKDRFVDVDGGQLKFIKPPEGFDFLRSMFSTDVNNRPEDIDVWCRRLIESTEDNAYFKSKIIPWLDALQGRRDLIARRVHLKRVH